MEYLLFVYVITNLAAFAMGYYVDKIVILNRFLKLPKRTNLDYPPNMTDSEKVKALCEAHEELGYLKGVGDFLKLI